MKRIVVLAGVAAILFTTMFVVELLKTSEPLSTTDFVLEFFEIGLLALAVAATAYVSLETRDMRRERADLLNDLTRARAEGDRWRTTARAHIEGLSRAIREQFDAWNLTESEADIAVLMLKGLSHKEISRLRDTGEATVRQQAAAIYRKSGLASRAELSAFFLEDLLAPGSEQAEAERPLKLVKPEA
jgi:DNA-binding CsgD family transcriptional regulator